MFTASKNCSCGKVHKEINSMVFGGAGCIGKLPEIVKELGMKKPLVVCDPNTLKAAGERVFALLYDAKADFGKFVFGDVRPVPSEKTVGSLVMNFPADCDGIIGVGSGVINDTCKIVSAVSGKKYILVATAPSMDGFTSSTSSMEKDGLKVSLPSRTADVIIGDVDILKTAPDEMLRAGLGDMLAKYVSIAEWRISNVILGEYYCEEIADIVRKSLNKCVDNAEGLMKRENEAVEAVFEGLVCCGSAMSYAGCSRPASGIEHYFSHIWDMRSLEFGTPSDLHGIQCAIGTLYAAREYEKLKEMTPNREKALKHAKEFDYEAWKNELVKLFGKGADAMIKLEEKEKKYDLSAHAARLDSILANWDKIVKIVEEEIPSPRRIEEILDTIGAPKSAREIGIDEGTLKTTFYATREIRFKYILSHLEWDIGTDCLSL